MSLGTEPTKPGNTPSGMQESAKNPDFVSSSDTAPQRKAPKPPKPWVTYGLMGFCILIFGLQLLSKSQLGLDLPFVYGGKINQAILAGQIWRLITPAFMHGNIYHLLFNMYALHVLGNRLENIYGHSRFAALYLVAAFGGNVMSFVLSKANSLGSSTAIFGLLAANLALLLVNREFFGENFRPILSNLVFLLFINLSIGIMPGSTIDNFGHLGGLIAGGFFAILAGPKWKVQNDNGLLRLKDLRSQREILLGLFMVFAAFVIMAAIPFLKR